MRVWKQENLLRKSWVLRYMSEDFASDVQLYWRYRVTLHFGGLLICRIRPLEFLLHFSLAVSDIGYSPPVDDHPLPPYTNHPPVFNPLILLPRSIIPRVMTSLCDKIYSASWKLRPLLKKLWRPQILGLITHSLLHRSSYNWSSDEPYVAYKYCQVNQALLNRCG
jgi:hypothetical protein